MHDDRPWFVKITGPGRYQIRPYGRGGWLLTGVWALALSAVCSLLFVEPIREQEWVVPLLIFAVTFPLVLFGMRTAVPVEELARPQRKSGRRRKGAGE